ncbi:unnamed protein product [Mytilus edulis]|uniref:Uncharacterized protein n=1 Tax=Mytilus edulis TaxID=6550 RepID=A0A8S3Q5M2_MYTED|nr:unnamed protein product [Mytilus edulis]
MNFVCVDGITLACIAEVQAILFSDEVEYDVKLQIIKQLRTSTSGIGRQAIAKAQCTFKHIDTFSRLYGNKASTKPLFTIDSDNKDETVSNSSCAENENAEGVTADKEKEVVTKKKVNLKKRPASSQDRLVALCEKMDKKNEEFKEMLLEQGERKLQKFDRFLDIYEKKSNN